VTAILLAETLITLGAALQRWCQGQEAWVPFTNAIAFQPAVVHVVEVGVIETLPYSCCSGCCNFLLEKGGSVGGSWVGVVGLIEHNLDVIRCAVWIIDLGPDGGDKDGEIVVVGTPETVAEHPTSHTGRYLKQVLKQHPPELLAG
jgi:excinuclease ABC subunit A